MLAAIESHGWGPGVACSSRRLSSTHQHRARADHHDDHDGQADGADGGDGVARLGVDDERPTDYGVEIDRAAGRLNLYPNVHRTALDFSYPRTGHDVTRIIGAWQNEYANSLYLKGCVRSDSWSNSGVRKELVAYLSDCRPRYYCGSSRQGQRLDRIGDVKVLAAGRRGQ